MRILSQFLCSLLHIYPSIHSIYALNYIVHKYYSLDLWIFISFKELIGIIHSLSLLLWIYTIDLLTLKDLLWILLTGLLSDNCDLYRIYNPIY